MNAANNGPRGNIVLLCTGRGADSVQEAGGSEETARGRSFRQGHRGAGKVVPSLLRNEVGQAGECIKCIHGVVQRCGAIDGLAFDTIVRGTIHVVMRYCRPGDLHIAYFSPPHFLFIPNNKWTE